MSPAALLHAYQQVYKATVANAYLMRIRGDHFYLGDALSLGARNHLAEAILATEAFCTTIDPPND